MEYTQNLHKAHQHATREAEFTVRHPKIYKKIHQEMSDNLSDISP
jgi:hypothetical protein